MAWMAAALLGMEQHHIPILVIAPLLKPLGNLPPNAPQYFAREYILALTDEKWLAEQSDALVDHWACSNRNKEREKTQMYMQRYTAHSPAAGEVVIFDRSRYNRAGVEYVMGFCSKEQHSLFLESCPEIEKYMVDGGTILIRFWLEVTDEDQKRRFRARITDPVRSDVDLGKRQVGERLVCRVTQMIARKVEKQ